MLAILVWYGNKDKGKIFLDLATDKLEEAMVTSPRKHISRILGHEEVVSNAFYFKFFIQILL